MNAQLHPIFQQILEPQHITQALCPLCHKPEDDGCDCKEGYCPDCREMTLGEAFEGGHICPQCSTRLQEPGDYAEPDTTIAAESYRIDAGIAQACNAQR